MPEDGIRYMPKKDLLTFEEITRLISIVASLGITKVRLTGGEPFVRNDLMKLIRNIVEIRGVRDLHLTTNGVLTAPHIPELKKLGIASVNLSLDTLDKQRFFAITRRDVFEPVMETLRLLVESEIPVKINAVVMDGKNIDDIIPLVELSKKNNVDVRFIEEMPFNGEGNHYPTLVWTYKKIIDYLKEHYPDLHKIPDPQFSTSYNYHVPGHKGNVGVIAAFSRTFCGTCNRVRVTAQGTLKTCLYDDGALELRQLLRASKDDSVIVENLIKVLNSRAKDGFEAEAKRKNHTPVSESMSTIGG
jgi:molybdenum cofactor biosynthesis protein A